MKMKRAADPEYRADERKKVGKRMRNRRDLLHANGLNNHGRPFSSPKRRAWSSKLSNAKRGKPFTGGTPRFEVAQVT
jgi:hypothetical protein